MIYQQALKMIDDILNDFGQKLCDFNGIPALDHNLAEECGASRIMAQEKNYDVEQLRAELSQMVPKFNWEKKHDLHLYRYL